MHIKIADKESERLIDFVTRHLQVQGDNWEKDVNVYNFQTVNNCVKALANLIDTLADKNIISADDIKRIIT